MISEIQGDEIVKKVSLKNVLTEETTEIATDGVFVFIGHTPSTQLFKGSLDLDEKGYIKTDLMLSTNVPGVYVAGEAGDPHYRQVVTSAGMGAAAAMQAIRFIQEQEESQPEAINA